MGEDGSGHIVDQVLGGGANCTRQPCAGSEGEWPVHIAETGVGQETMEVRFCWEQLDGTSPVHCSVDLALTPTTYPNVELAATDQRCHATSGTSETVELTGHWLSEEAESTTLGFIHH